MALRVGGYRMTRRRGVSATRVVFTVIAIVIALFVADQVIVGMEDITHTDSNYSTGRTYAGSAGTAYPTVFLDTNGTMYNTWSFLGLNNSGSGGIMGVIGIIGVGLIILQLVDFRKTRA